MTELINWLLGNQIDIAFAVTHPPKQKPAIMVTLTLRRLPNQNFHTICLIDPMDFGSRSSEEVIRNAVSELYIAYDDYVKLQH